MKKLINPLPEQLPDTAEAFIRQMAAPLMIYISGQQSDRTRAIVTLMHGNEPSGLRAVFRWLKSGQKPLCNILCIMPSIPAAIEEELFKHRIYPGQRDMNRCFLPPYLDAAGMLAEEILALFVEHQPECIVDLHNTSGHSPDFAVVTVGDATHEALVSLFTNRLVITDLRLGALMETTTRHCPVVTIECGGVHDAQSDVIAWTGLQRYLHEETILQLAQGQQLDLYRHPVRLELDADTIIAFAEHAVTGIDLTVPQHLDQHNFGTVEPGTLIAWLGSQRAGHCLKVQDALGNNCLQQYFEVKGNQLLTVQRLKLFMITTRPDIALSDCLLYAAAESEHEIMDT